MLRDYDFHVKFPENNLKFSIVHVRSFDRFIFSSQYFIEITYEGIIIEFANMLLHLCETGFYLYG